MLASNPTNRLHCQHSPTTCFESKQAAHQAHWRGSILDADPPAQGVKIARRMTVNAVLTERAPKNKEKLDWRHSIVDLMKLLNLDSSLTARKALAQELHYTGDMNDSATMNIWLHKQVMRKLAENGGNVPADLMD